MVCVFGEDVVAASMVGESTYSCLTPLFRAGDGDVVFRFGERMSKLLEQVSTTYQFYRPCAVARVKPDRLGRAVLPGHLISCRRRHVGTSVMRARELEPD